MAKGTFTDCPRCGARVTKEKLRRHLNAVHGEGAPAKRPITAPRPATVSFPWRMIAALGIVAVVVVAGYWFLTQPPPEVPPGPIEGPVAVIETNFGTFRIALDTARAPATASNFINLVQSKFYDGGEFHRVAFGSIHVIQGGAGEPVSTVRWEATGLRNVRFSIAMARSGDPNSVAAKDTATSQFFINVHDNAALDSYAYPYVVFGRIVGGGSVVESIGALYPAGQPSYDGRPTQQVTIVRVTIV